MAKDLFSAQADDYAKYRPDYPSELYSFLTAQVKNKDLAWDVATGNGQAAVELAKNFKKVVATDLSEKQLSQAKIAANILYKKAVAQDSGLADKSTDLVTVAQAFHWFAHDDFYAEVKRVAKPDSLLAIWCYGLAHITPEIDALVSQLYEGELGPYWEKERKLVEEGYRNVKIPFSEMDTPKFAMEKNWSCQDLLGYFNTWSALQTYKKKIGIDPLVNFAPKLEKIWGSDKTKKVSWPLSVRVFRL